MTLIKSISGIRGTIGGKPGECLSPVDIVKFAAAYGTWIKKGKKKNIRVVVGRDARTSGPMVSSIVTMTLTSMGIDITDLGLASTPTVEIAVTGTSSDGGIIITASHNPGNWNALKLLNSKGEFLSSSDGAEVLDIAESEEFDFVSVGSEGRITYDNSWDQKHIQQVLNLEMVDVKAIKTAKLTVAVDCINSVGGIIIPQLLEALGVRKVERLNCTPDGLFSHNPEPLPENLNDISKMVSTVGADLGFVVDPDVDRLAIICEDGSMFGEEYTLVAVSDYILSASKGGTVSNLSSTRALRDITEKHGCNHYSSAVGEVNVVEEMKKRNAVIGGEGNGGVIYPAIHYGRDALVGIALFLTYFSKSQLKCTELRKRFPDYFMAKKRIDAPAGLNFKAAMNDLREKFRDSDIDERDGMKIDFPEGWVQVRKSNTEPIIRIYAEGRTTELAGKMADEVIEIVKKH